jgi:hypothetical protein
MTTNLTPSDPVCHRERIAQFPEQLTLNQRVEGSSPPAPTIKSTGYEGPAPNNLPPNNRFRLAADDPPTNLPGQHRQAAQETAGTRGSAGGHSPSLGDRPPRLLTSWRGCAEAVNAKSGGKTRRASPDEGKRPRA